MKRKIIIVTLIISLLAGLAACGTGGNAALDEPVEIVTASDLHYISPEINDNGEYFMNMMMQADGKVSHHAEAVTEAFCYEQMVNKPDIVILSGDLTMNGAKQSHLDLIDKLAKLQESGVQVLVIPGNHDVDMENAFSFEGAEYGIVDDFTSAEFIELYADFGLNQARSTDETTFSYIYEASPKLWIAMLDSNCYSGGFVRDETIEWLEGELEAAKKQGIEVITVTHQNVLAHSDLLKFGYQLYNYKDLLALYEEYGVKLNLTGHIHIQNIISEGDFTEISTSSLITTNLQYGSLTYDGTSLNYEVKALDVEGWAADNGITDETLNNFSVYAPEFFKEVGRNRFMIRNNTDGYSEAEAAVLAETFVDINLAYFAGMPLDLNKELFSDDETAVYDLFAAEEFAAGKSFAAAVLGTEYENATIADGVEFWRSQPEGIFHQSYIESMLEASDTERGKLIVEF